MAASVSTYTSIVAWGTSCGWIIPEPLPKAATRTSRVAPSASFNSSRAKAIFSTRSVVRIACAASEKSLGSEPTLAASSGNAAISFSAGSGTPMIPVEDGNTSSARQTNVRATAAQVSRAARRPASPAAQLAFPALMAATRTRPPVELKCSLSMINGAAITRFDVNAAAALAGASATIRAKSGRPLAFRPAFTAPNRNPLGMVFFERSLMRSSPI